MGKGAFRGSLHFLRAASTAERPHPPQAPLSGKPTARFGWLTHAIPAGRASGRRRPGIRPLLRFRAGRHPYRHPTALPTAGQTDTRFIRQTRARVAPDRDAPGHPCLPTTRPGRGRTPSGPDRANMLPCLPDLPAPRHDHGHARGRGVHPPTDPDPDCGTGFRTRQETAAPDPARRPGLPEKGRKPCIHICICLPFKFLRPSPVSDRRRKPLSFKFMFLLIVDYVS